MNEMESTDKPSLLEIQVQSGLFLWIYLHRKAFYLFIYFWNYSTKWRKL